MNLKDLIFGGGVKSGGDGGTYRDSIQAWLPIKNIIGGVVIDVLHLAAVILAGLVYDI